MFDAVVLFEPLSNPVVVVWCMKVVLSDAVTDEFETKLLVVVVTFGVLVLFDILVDGYDIGLFDAVVVSTSIIFSDVVTLNSSEIVVDKLVVKLFGEVNKIDTPRNVMPLLVKIFVVCFFQQFCSFSSLEI